MVRFKTGIKGLDEMLYGGFCVPKNRGYMVLVKGDAGTGKSILASQMAANYSNTHLHNSVVYLVCDNLLPNPSDRIREYIRRFSFGKGIQVLPGGKLRKLQNKWETESEKLNGEGLIFTDFPPGGDIREFMHYFLGIPGTPGTFKSYEEFPRKPGVYVIDPLDLYGDSVLKDQWQTAFYPVQETPGRIGILVKKNDVGDLGSVVDAIIEVGFIREGLDTKRCIEVLKAQGQKHYLGKRIFDITEDGIIVNGQK